MKPSLFILHILPLLFTACSSSGGDVKQDSFELQEVTDEAVKIVTTRSIEDSLAELQIPIEERIIDKSVDLRVYFDSIQRYTNAELWIHRRDDPDDYVWESMDELTRFIHGKRDIYPVKEVRKVIYWMGVEQAYLESHGGLDDEGLWYGTAPNAGERFMLRYIEQVARYCPRIELLTDVYSEDGEVGVLNILSWSNYPFYAFIFNKVGKGYHVEIMKDLQGEVSQIAIEEISKLVDEKGRAYYLCAHSDEKNANYFLYRINGSKLRLVACTEE